MGRRLISLLVAALSGAAVYFAFPSANLWILAPLGLAALAWAVARHGAGFAFLLGLTHGVAFFLPLLTWAKYSVGPIPWVALSLCEALFMGAAMSVWVLARRGVKPRGLADVAFFAIAWVAAEELRSRVPFGGFPWGRVAFSQLESPVVRFAWLGGAPLVGLLVAVTGAGLWAALLQRQIALAPLIVALLITPAGLLLPLDTRPQAGSLHVAAVQGNVPDKGLDAFNQAREVLNNHLAVTAALPVAQGDLDIVIWPENGSDVNPEHDAEAASQLDAVSAQLGAPILVGTLEYPSTGGRYNRSMLWQAGAGVLDYYDKQRPAAFAEYIPMREFARIFSADVDRVTVDMLPGTGPATIDLPSARLDRTVIIGDVICFEVAYDVIVRDAVLAGGEFLVVQTNNASFGRTDESVQQLAMSRFRAIELGRTTIQISTVGVSGVIAPNGVITDQTGHFEPAHMITNVPLRTSLTPAARFASLIAWTLALACPLTLIVGRLRSTHATPAPTRRPRPKGRS